MYSPGFLEDPKRCGISSVRLSLSVVVVVFVFIIIWMAVVLVINRGRVKYGESHLFSLGSL